MPIKKVLIVDDSPTERFFLNELLTKQRLSPSSMAENADEAMIKVKAVMPDLILMDVVMPGQNGFQLTRALSKDPVTQDIPIIMCTSKNQQTDRIWGLRQGARDYVTKPVKPEELLEKILALDSALIHHGHAKREVNPRQLVKLREFSSQLAQRLKEAPNLPTEPTRLAIRIGAEDYLVEMALAPAKSSRCPRSRAFLGPSPGSAD